MGFLEKEGLLGVCADGFPEAGAALEVMLLLVLGEAEFGVEHVLGADEMAERRDGGGAHFESSVRSRGFVWLLRGC